MKAFLVITTLFLSLSQASFAGSLDEDAFDCGLANGLYYSSSILNSNRYSSTTFEALKSSMEVRYAQGGELIKIFREAASNAYSSRLISRLNTALSTLQSALTNFNGSEVEMRAKETQLKTVFTNVQEQIFNASEQACN